MARADFFSDLDCPQFVDFASGVGEAHEEYFEDAKNKNCLKDLAQTVNSHLFHPNEGVNKKGTELGRKENIAKENETIKSKKPRLLYSTPDLKGKNIKRQEQDFRFLNVNQSTACNKKDFCSSRRRSKSQTSIKEVCKGVSFIKQTKKSVSSDDLRAKKIKYPGTPMCLKRPKKVKQLKTSEELELEKIAELQKQLTLHLRFNEMSMNRLKMKKKPTQTQSNAPVKAFANPFAVKTQVKETNKVKKSTATDVFNKITEEMAERSKFRKSKVNPVYALPSLPQNNKSTHESKNACDQSQNSSILSCNSVSDVEKNTGMKRRPLGFQNYDFHSGVPFSGTAKKFTIVKPFSFDNKPRKVKEHSENERQNGVNRHGPFKTPFLKISKENIPSYKKQEK